VDTEITRSQDGQQAVAADSRRTVLRATLTVFLAGAGCYVAAIVLLFASLATGDSDLLFASHVFGWGEHACLAGMLACLVLLARSKRQTGGDN
jgi:hypothetical protein